MSFIESKYAQEIINFKFPKFKDIPDIGLYMEQMLKLLNTYLSVFAIKEEQMMTSTMVNNYVKQKLITPPVNKKYSRTQMLYLLVICLLKQILNISDIAKLLEWEKLKYETDVAYNFFCVEIENALHAAFVTRDFSAPTSAKQASEISELFRSEVLAFANKIYVTKYICYLNDSNAKI